MIKGIDISNHQKGLNIKNIESDIEFVIAKQSEGYGFVDALHDEFKKQSYENNKEFGSYHFARPDLGNTGKIEADFFVRCLGEISDGQILVLDYETPAPNLNVNQEVEWCYEFLVRVEELTGIKPLLYINQAYNNKYNWAKVINNGNGIWIASWFNNPDLNYPPSTKWPFVAIWQYTSSGSVNNWNGRIDRNVFYGTREQFKKYGKNTKQQNNNNDINNNNNNIDFNKMNELENKINQMIIDDQNEDLEYERKIKEAESSVISLSQILEESRKRELEYKGKISLLELRIGELETKLNQVLTINESLQAENNQLKDKLNNSENYTIIDNNQKTEIETKKTFKENLFVFFRELKIQLINLSIGLIGLVSTLATVSIDQIPENNAIIVAVSSFFGSVAMSKALGKSFVTQIFSSIKNKLNKNG